MSKSVARARVGVIALALTVAAGCGDGDSPVAPPTAARFLIRACAASNSPGETFRIETNDPETIAQAQALVGRGSVKVLSGRLQADDGGFNAPWHWHLSPSTIEFVDATVEVCDGCPHDVEAQPDYWVHTVGSFCPWSTEVIARER